MIVDMAAIAGKPREKITLLQPNPLVMQGGELDKIIAGHGGTALWTGIIACGETTKKHPLAAGASS